MTAKALSTPEAMIADVLGAKKGQSPRTAPAKAERQPVAAAEKEQAPSTGRLHRLQVHISHELYAAMQYHRCTKGFKLGEKSLKDVATHAIEAYVADALKEVRRHG